MVVKMLKIRIIESYKARYKRYSWLKNPLDRNIIKKNVKYLCSQGFMRKQYDE